MKVNTVKQEVISSGISNISNFSIKATAKSFAILSDGLYSNKIVAIVREIGCNAVDAHVMVGKADLPIEVRLPSHLDPTFYVKDFGPGLSHEQIVGYWTNDEPPVYVGGLYNTYFESTKTSSNDFIGALGLGSKSPFSYVSNFIVESRQNGVCNVYSCFKDENNFPSVALLSSHDTTEENGLTVKLTVKSADVAEFASAAKNVFAYFSVCPTVLGYDNFAPDYVTYTLSGTNWKLCEYSRHSNDYYNQSCKVIQGSIAYPVDRTALSDNLSETGKLILRLPLHIFMNIGDVEVAASRESLSYDKRTINNIVAVLEKCASEFHDTIQQTYDNCCSEWEAGIVLSKLTKHGLQYYSERLSAVYTDLHKTYNFNWKGNPIPTALSIAQYADDFNIRSYVKSQGKLTFNATLSEELTIIQNTLVIFDLYVNTLSTYNSMMNSLDNKISNILIIKPKNRRQIDLEKMNNIRSLFGSDVTILDATKPVVYQKTKNVTSDIQSLRITKQPVWTKSSVDITNDAFLYVHMKDDKCYTGAGKFINRLDDFIRTLSELNIGCNYDTVIGLTKRQIQTASKNKKCCELFQYVRALMSQEDLTNDYESFVAKRYVDNELPWSTRSFLQRVTSYTEMQSTELGKLAVDYIDKTKFKNTKFGVDHDFSFFMYTIDLFDESKKMKLMYEMKMRCDNVFNKYPLIKYALSGASSSYSEHRKNIDAELLDYINLVDNRE